jgi:putative endopeptidase
MSLRLFAGVAAAALITTGFAASQAAAPRKPAAKRMAPKAATSSKSQLGTFGVELSNMDKSVKPGDDFYNFVNGGWNARTEIPADKASWGGFGILRELSDQRTRAIIETVAKAKSAPGSVSQKVGDVYASFMDEAAIEAKGLAPIKGEFARIDGIQNGADLSRAFAVANRIGISTPIGIGVEQDLKDNTTYAAYVGQGGLGMPDRDYYLLDDAKYVETRGKYKAHIAAMLKLAGIADGEAKAETIYALEAKIAATHWTSAESRQIDKLYNPMTIAQLGEKMPGFDWPVYINAAGLGAQKSVVATQVSALVGAAKLISSEPMSVWKDYLKFHTLKDAAPLLPKALVDENFAFDGKVLSGTPQLRDRWKRGVSMVNGALGEAVGQIYVAKHFPPASKAKADTLVQNLIKAFDGRLGKLEWMDAATKAKARVKLAAFTPKIGYPSKWRDYSALKIVRGDAYGNAVRVADFEHNRQLAKIGKPVDRTEWFMTPQTVNAYANPLMNEIVFPAAILQAPFFDPNADPAVNYGGIGAVIGHEISHHFDDQGRKFDAKGNLTEWWTPEDIKRFDALTKQVVDQYGEYEPIPGKKINGELTLGENIADLAGLTVAYDAYRLSLNGKEAPVIGGLTGDQRFFLGFGQVWQNKSREASILAQLTSDPHSPAMFRPRVVRNLDAWYPAFNVQTGEKLYLAPDKRIRVW